jgi:hypothetical protein
MDISMFNTDDLKLVLFFSLINKSVSKTQFNTSETGLDDYKLALTAVKKGYIDRFNGRVFKSNISGDTFNTYLYNRDNGAGAAERIVESIRLQLNL